MTEQTQIPSPQESDSDEIRWALETARSLWSSDAREALRWLRRAAETASDMGDDLRSVQLARAAADLRAVANIGGSLPPPASMPIPVAAAPLEPASSEPLPSHPVVAVSAAPIEEFPVAAAVAPVAVEPAPAAVPVQAAVPAQAAVPVQAAVPPAVAPQAKIEPLASATSTPLVGRAAAPRPLAAQPALGSAPPPLPAEYLAAPRPVVAAAPAVAAAPVVAAAPAVAATPAVVAPAVVAPAVQLAVAVPAVVQPAMVQPAMLQPAVVQPVVQPAPVQPALAAVNVAEASAAPSFIAHQALRVAFNPESDEFGQLLVRPLIEGEEPPAGWVTALLVGLDSGNVVLAG